MTASEEERDKRIKEKERAGKRGEKQLDRGNCIHPVFFIAVNFPLIHRSVKW